MDHWVDSEFEDSPRSQDGGGAMGFGFEASPNSSPAQYQHVQRVPPPRRKASQGVYHNLPAHGGPLAAHQYQDVPVRMVPEAALHPAHGGLLVGGQQAKRLLIRRIQQDSMKMLTMTCNAVMVRGPTGRYCVYHLEITSDYYKQKWVVCKRYSEFYRLRKRLLERLAAHKKQRQCPNCTTVGAQLKDFGFPSRFEMFQDKAALVTKRTSGLEEFIVALCQYIGGDDAFDVCSEINSSRFMVKEFLQFPLDHECQHVRAIRNLKYVDPRDVHVDTESCPICLSEWRELDGNQLVLSPCGHFFHENCINEWYRTRFDCPMCRTIAGEEE